MQDQDVSVRVLEGRLQADAGVHRLAEELDPGALQLGAGPFDVGDPERDGAGARRELAADRRGVENLQGEVAGLELATRDPLVGLRLLEAERAAVELGRAREIGDEDGQEVGAFDPHAQSTEPKPTRWSFEATRRKATLPR